MKEKGNPMNVHEINKIKYKIITDSIVNAIESDGFDTWVKSWSANEWARNHITGRGYRGINILLLGSSQTARRYPFNRWMTHKQLKDIGGRLNKGEKPTSIFFCSKVETRESKEKRKLDPDLTPQLFFMMKEYEVFNVAQTNIEVKIESDNERRADVESFISGIEHDIFLMETSTPCYIRWFDQIRMPFLELFNSEERYYVTYLHELVHWTSHKDRLNRSFRKPVRPTNPVEYVKDYETAYMKEELVAELGSAFLCSHLGIESGVEHQNYIGSWLDSMKQDPRLIYQLANRAQEAAEYLIDLSEKGRLKKTA